jgi:hypothetical protein
MHPGSPFAQFLAPPRTDSAELFPLPIDPTSQLAASPGSAGHRGDDLASDGQRTDARVEPDLVSMEGDESGTFSISQRL